MFIVNMRERMHLKGQANTNCLPCCLSLSALVFPFHCCCCCCWLPSDLICVEFRLKTNEMDSKSLPFSAVFPPVRFSEPHSYGLLHTRPSHSAYHARELRGYFIIFSVYPFDSPFFRYATFIFSVFLIYVRTVVVVGFFQFFPSLGRSSCAHCFCCVLSVCRDSQHCCKPNTDSNQHTVGKNARHCPSNNITNATNFAIRSTTKAEYNVCFWSIYIKIAFSSFSFLLFFFISFPSPGDIRLFVVFSYKCSAFFPFVDIFRLKHVYVCLKTPFHSHSVCFYARASEMFNIENATL